MLRFVFFFFFSSRRRHTRYWRDWSSDVCSSDLAGVERAHTLEVLAAQARGDADAVLARLDACRREPACVTIRSEERRGGKEGRSRWAPDHLKKKKDVK